MAQESTGLRTEGSQSTSELVRDAVDRGSWLLQSETQLAKAEVVGSLKAAVLAAAGAATGHSRWWLSSRWRSLRS